MKTFKKDIETKQGVIAQNHVVTEIRVVLYQDGQNPNENFQQPAVVEIGLYKDKQTINGGRNKLQTMTYIIDDISKLQSYPTLVQEIMGLLLTAENSPIRGAQVDDTAD